MALVEAMQQAAEVLASPETSPEDLAWHEGMVNAAWTAAMGFKDRELLIALALTDLVRLTAKHAPRIGVHMAAEEARLRFGSLWPERAPGLQDHPDEFAAAVVAWSDREQASPVRKWDAIVALLAVVGLGVRDPQSFRKAWERRRTRPESEGDF